MLCRTKVLRGLNDNGIGQLLAGKLFIFPRGEPLPLRGGRQGALPPLRMALCALLTLDIAEGKEAVISL